MVAPAARPAARSGARNPVPWLVGLVVVLAIAVVALAAALVAPTLSTPKSQAMVDANITAWNVPAAQDVIRFYAADAVIWSSDSSTPAAKTGDEIISLAQYGGFDIERIGPVSERGNLVWYPAHIANRYDVSGSDAVVVFYMQDGKIVQHWVVWDELE
jgi:hypothetical protein